MTTSKTITTRATAAAPERPHLSHSQIKTYATCPRRYQLERGIGCAQRAPQAPSDALMVGTAAHSALEAFCQALRDQTLGALPLTLDELRETALAALARELEQRDPWALLTTPERRELRARLLHLMAQFYNGALRGWLRESADGAAQVIGVEAAFSLPLVRVDAATDEVTDTGYDFAGRVDVIRQLQRGAGAGQTEIADFKTAGKPWAKDVEHTDGQASAYAWAELAQTGELPARVVFYVANVSVHSAHGGRSLYPLSAGYEARTTTRDEAAVGAYQRYVVETLDHIQEDTAAAAHGEPQAFAAHTSPLCGWCGVLASCAAGRAYLRERGRTPQPLVARHIDALNVLGAAADGTADGEA